MLFRSQFHYLNKEKWQLMYLGTRKMLGLSNLYLHKRLDQIVYNLSYFQANKAPIIAIEPGDHNRPEPIRAQWMINLRKYNYDYGARLGELKIPVLICVGAHDLQTPLTMSLTLHKSIPASTLLVFNESGHMPFEEERGTFVELITNWLE